jgi:hypothetical protein
LGGGRKILWHFLQILLAYWQKTHYFCSPFEGNQTSQGVKVNQKRERIGSSAG